jgi:hypothetical protein
MLRLLPRPTFGPLSARRSRALGRRAAPAAMALLGSGSAADWRLGEPLDGRGYASVFPVRHGHDSAALLKATDTGRGRAELQREVDALAALHADARLDGWADLLPRTLATGAMCTSSSKPACPARTSARSRSGPSATGW